MSKEKMSKGKKSKKISKKQKVERKNVEKKKCRIDRKSCLMLIMKHLFDFNEKRKIRLLQLTNSQKKLFEKGEGVGVRMWVRV